LPHWCPGAQLAAVVDVAVDATSTWNEPQENSIRSTSRSGAMGGHNIGPACRRLRRRSGAVPRRRRQPGAIGSTS
jgi:hypothetical protein